MVAIKVRNILAKNGQSLVETALILPVILLVLTGIIDFGLLFNNYLIIANASREGARIAAVGATDTEIGSRISNVTSTLESGNLTTSVYPAEALRKNGEEVIVTVGYDYDLLTPLISAIVPNPVHVEGRTVMRIE